MSISEKVRKDFEEGKRDSSKGAVDQFVIDIFENHPKTDAYYKVRSSKQLDGDKKGKSKAIFSIDKWKSLTLLQ